MRPNNPGVILTACLLFSCNTFAAPSISLSKKIGPPTSRILVSGSGFEANVGVDIYFDTEDEALVVTDNEGKFHNARIRAPRSAYPGEHWVKALERNNDRGDQEPFVVFTNWLDFHFSPDNKGLNPYENVLSPSNVSSLALRWTLTTDGFVQGSPTVANGILYVASNDSYLYALNAGTGAQMWRYSPGGSGHAAVVNDGAVYVSTGYLLALNARNGSLLWRDLSNLQSGPPVVVGGSVYAGWNGNSIAAFDAESGLLQWSYATGNLIYSSPAVVDGVLYVGSLDNSVYALSARTGAKLWSYATGNMVYSSPAVADGVVYVGSGDNIYALNASTGALLWSYATGNYVDSSPAVANGVVYVGSRDNSMYALDAISGAKLWSYATGGDVGSSPAVANGVVYFGSADDNIYALEASTGVKLWSYATGASVASSVTVANGIVYSGSDDNNIYAFSLPGAGSAEAGLANRPDFKTLRPDLTLLQASTAAEDSGRTER